MGDALSVPFIVSWDGPLGNLSGGDEVQKEYSRKGKLNKMKKKSWTPINPKKIFMLWPKKNSYEKFGNEKKFLSPKNSPPPPPP